MDEHIKSTLELQVVAALRDRSVAPTSQCYDPEDLLSLVDEGESLPQSATMLGHLVICPCCRQLYAEIRRDLWQAGQLRAAAAPTPLASSLRVVEGWLSRLSSQVTQSLELLRAPAPSFAFSTTEDHELRQELHFADEQARGSYYREGTQRWIHFEHPEWLAGSLILLEAAGDTGEVTWRQFAVLGEGWESAEAEIPLTEGGVEQLRLSVGVVSAPDLPASAASILQRSFEAARTGNPATAAEWRHWAAANLTSVREPSLHGVVTGILEA